jgi:hypothetical protein
MGAQADELKRVLLSERVLSLPQIMHTLRGSRRTAIRRLNDLGYLSSYSHAGKFYALADAARFDSFGLWHYGDVHFSRWGTLKASVAELVERSPAGYRPRELAALTGVRCYNVLGELARDCRVRRGPVAGTHAHFYFSVHAARRAQQIARRERQVERERPFAQRFGRPPIGWRAALAVVVELVKSPEAGPATIAHRLRACGLEVSAQEVREVFRTYGLDKKRAR